MRAIIGISALVLVLGVLHRPAAGQDFGDPESLRTVMREQMARMSSPELEERMARRRWFQQRGYTSVLYDVVRHDGLGAVISYLRMIARLELALPHDRLYLYVPVRQPDGERPGLPGFTGRPSGPLRVPLQEPREFPADPWKRQAP